VLAPNSGLLGSYCSFPFNYAEIHRGGDVFLCCPTWSGSRSIGNIFSDTPTKLWNSIQAQKIRSGIINGSFSECEHHICPIMASQLRPRTDADETRTKLPHGPQHVKLCHDDTCNLSCPSCRTGMIVAGREQQAQLDRMLHEFIIPFLADARVLDLSGDGDPFASRHYRMVLKETAQNLPHLRINLHTNAVLCDERSWDDCALSGRVDTVMVSIDAATPATYSVVRRGGDFDRLLQNLDFLSVQRTQNKIKRLWLAFVVQQLNFREMPAFVRMGKALGVDRIHFSNIQHWSRAMTEVQFKDAQVCREDHLLHSELSRVLIDPIFRDPIVDLGNVHKLVAPQTGAGALQISTW
jgi:wyosine [tRNA(Phe)-imidazoG37] synthetase (radical SAM superfamily)